MAASANKLAELRAILLGSDQTRLEAVARRIEQPDTRAADVAEVLPESIAVSFRRDARLVEALRTPLRDCVSRSVRDSPEEYADALFPVMGPAIRRAVGEALKTWLQQANTAIEQSLSPRGLRWRLEAWRAGVPYGEYVLQRSLVYRVEHAYLIHSPSGLLMAHVQQPDASAKDEDAVSAMFTAIQEFVRDSFSRADEPQRLQTAELGDFVLWAVHGPSGILVAVIRGAPPVELRARLQVVLEEIAVRYEAVLGGYSGDRAATRGIETVLARCLSSSSAQPDARRRRVKPALVVATLVGVLLIGLLGYRLWLDARASRAAEALSAAPGIAVTAIERDGDTLVVRGLRDRLAADVADIAARSGWPGRVETAFTAFLSLDPVIVLERARLALDPPAGVELQLADATLQVSGTASAAWAERARIAVIPGVDAVDLASLAVLPAEPPPDPAASWRRDLDAIAAEVAALSIDFSTNADSAEPQELAKLAGVAPRILEYGSLAARLSLSPRVTLLGRSTDSGPHELNLALERRRAEHLAAALRSAGVPAEWLAARSQFETGASGPRRPQVGIVLETFAPPR
jgi:OOP family OmpA-OmpF porin